VDGVAPPELSIVIPVFDEQGTLAEVLLSWAAELDRLGIDYELRVYDDGSRDDTPHILQSLAGRVPRLLMARHANRGHGPTILRGYREARGGWLFQADSDGEILPAAFRGLWEEREGYDLLLGCRQDRRAGPARRLISLAARGTVSLLFGRALRDVNTPFRLMRRDRVLPLFDLLPDHLFAPNVALSGLAAAAGLRIREIPVPYQGRRNGGGSLLGPRLWVCAVRSFRETLGVARLAGRQRRILGARRPP
jgi:dolichol-phosphate mannosyltransferase